MTDRRTDRQTDGIAMAYTRYSYAVARNEREIQSTCSELNSLSNCGFGSSSLVTSSNITDAINRFKIGKFDGYAGLSTDHFVNVGI